MTTTMSIGCSTAQIMTAFIWFLDVADAEQVLVDRGACMPARQTYRWLAGTGPACMSMIVSLWAYVVSCEITDRVCQDTREDLPGEHRL